MADLAGDILRADAVATSAERGESRVLQGAAAVRGQITEDLQKAYVVSGALRAIESHMSVVNYAQAIAKTPGLREAAEAELSKLPNLQERQAPSPVRGESSVVQNVPTPVLIQAARIQGERANELEAKGDTREAAATTGQIKSEAIERGAADRLAHEFEVRRTEMLRGVRRSDEFREPTEQESQRAVVVATHVRAETHARAVVVNEVSRVVDHERE